MLLLIRRQSTKTQPKSSSKNRSPIEIYIFSDSSNWFMWRQSSGLHIDAINGLQTKNHVSLLESHLQSSCFFDIGKIQWSDRPEIADIKKMYCCTKKDVYRNLIQRKSHSTMAENTCMLQIKKSCFVSSLNKNSRCILLWLQSFSSWDRTKAWHSVSWNHRQNQIVKTYSRKR